MTRLLVGVLTVALAGAGQRSADADDVRFLWAFGAITGPASARKLVRVTDDITLRSGDQVKMFLKPVTSCFVYVLAKDPEGVVSVLFPDAEGRFPAGYGSGAEHHLPPGDAWYRLEESKGRELVYLVASASRLARLEAILKQHASITVRSGPGSAAAKAVHAAAARDINTEIANLRQQHDEPWSEKPVTIGGQVRGVDRADVKAFATEISAKGFFSRVYVIEHR